MGPVSINGPTARRPDGLTPRRPDGQTPTGAYASVISR